MTQSLAFIQIIALPNSIHYHFLDKHKFNTITVLSKDRVFGTTIFGDVDKKLIKLELLYVICTTLLILGVYNLTLIHINVNKNQK
jgi:hypothetical protein